MNECSEKTTQKNVTVQVDVDVQNFKIRAWLLPKYLRAIPTDEVGRTINILSTNNFDEHVKHWKLNIEPILTDREYRKLMKMAGQLGISGYRGTATVNVSASKLLQFIKENEKRKEVR